MVALCGHRGAVFGALKLSSAVPLSSRLGSFLVVVRRDSSLGGTVMTHPPMATVETGPGRHSLSLSSYVLFGLHLSAAILFIIEDALLLRVSLVAITNLILFIYLQIVYSHSLTHSLLICPSVG